MNKVPEKYWVLRRSDTGCTGSTFDVIMQFVAELIAMAAKSCFSTLCFDYRFCQHIFSPVMYSKRSSKYLAGKLYLRGNLSCPNQWLINKQQCLTWRKHWNTVVRSFRWLNFEQPEMVTLYWRLFQYEWHEPVINTEWHISWNCRPNDTSECLWLLSLF